MLDNTLIIRISMTGECFPGLNLSCLSIHSFKAHASPVSLTFA